MADGIRKRGPAQQADAQPANATGAAPDNGAESQSAEATTSAAPPKRPTKLQTSMQDFVHITNSLEFRLGAAMTVICIVLMYFMVDRTPVNKKLWDKQTLALYIGDYGNPPYLAILGDVFDVTKGKKHYSKDGYGFFLGTDASRAFVTGEFKEDLNDEVSDFEADQAKSLIDWHSFFNKTYPFKGRVIGRFYNKQGQPTRLLGKLRERAATAKSHDEKQKEYLAQFPQCNVRWTEAEGGVVWCDGNAYPRRVFLKDVNGRPNTMCLCFQELGWSDLRQVYKGCKPDAHECKVPKDPETAAKK